MAVMAKPLEAALKKFAIGILETILFCICRPIKPINITDKFDQEITAIH